MTDDPRSSFDNADAMGDGLLSETLSPRQRAWLEGELSVATLDWRLSADSESERSLAKDSQPLFDLSQALSMLPARGSVAPADSGGPIRPFESDAKGPPDSDTAARDFAAGESVDATAPPPANGRGGKLGNGTPDYLLRKKIGEGGMGVVWQATQTSLSREVAIKRLKGDADWMDFLQEAFTSAELDHPNIVPVHDLARLADHAAGGEATPAIAMKMVQGTAWNVLVKSDRKDDSLTREDFLAKHLRILIDVCHAVAYAHAKHIVHRDLKPHQVMLGEFGEVFLMDWGLAITMLEEPPTVAGQGIPKHRSRSTGGNPCGSPAYMAPEQTDATAARLGPATDVYLLGAILYELVCGAPPHFAENGRAAFHRASANDFAPVPADAPEELRLLIEEALATDPADRPASVAAFRDRVEDYLSGAGKRRESRELAAKARKQLEAAGGDYGALADVLTVAGRARAQWADNPELPELEADALSSYAEAAISHGDLTLAKVHAERIPESDERRRAALDRVAELEARHRRRERQRRLALATVALLAIGVLATLLFALDSRSRQQIALREGQLSRERADRLEKERQLADERSLRLEAERAEQERVANLFQSVNELRRDENQLAREMSIAFPIPKRIGVEGMEIGSESIASHLAQSGVYVEDGAFKSVDPRRVAELKERREELALRRADIVSRVGEDKIEDQPASLVLANATLVLKFALSPSQAMEAYELYAAARVELPRDPDPIVGMAVAAARADHYTSAIALLEEAAAIAKETYGEENPRTADILGMAGDAAILMGDDESVFRLYLSSSDLLERRWIDLTRKLYLHTYYTGDYARAKKMAESVLEAQRRREPEDSWDLLAARITMASAETSTGNYETAEETLRDVLRVVEESGQGDGEHGGMVKSRLASLLIKRGDYRGAEAILREAVDALEDSGAGASHSGIARAQIADAVFMQGRYAEALDRFREAEAVLVAASGDQHPNAVVARHGQTKALRALGRFAEAEAIARAELASIESIVVDPAHTIRGMALNDLGSILADQGRFREAVACIEEALGIYRAKYALRGTKIADILGGLANVYKQLGEYGKAEDAAREAISIWNARNAPRHPSRLNALNCLAVVLDNTDRRDEAIEMYREALDGMIAIADKPDLIATTMGNFAVALTRRGDVEEAEKLLRESLARQIEAVGDSHPNVAVRHNSLAFNLMNQKRYAEADEHLRAALAIQREKLGDHIDTGVTLYNLAQNLGYLGKWDEGEPMLKEAIRLFIEAGGERHPNTASARRTLAYQLEQWKRWPEAAETRALSADYWEWKAGPRSHEAVTERDSVAVDYYRAKDWANSAAWFAGNYLLDDQATELSQRRLEWLGQALSRAGEHAAAAPPIRKALSWRLENLEEPRASDSLFRKFADALIETTDLAPPPDHAPALVLGLGALLETDAAAIASFKRNDLAGASGDGRIARLARMARAALALEQPSTEAAERLAMRAAALASAARLPADHKAREEELDPLLERLGLAERAASLAPPDDFWPSPAEEPIDGAKLQAWLDAVAPAVDWPSALPEVAAWSVESLKPSEDAQAALARSIDRALELGDGPPSARELGSAALK